MGLINDEQPIGWQIIKQRRWWLTRRSPGEIAGVIFNTGAVPQLLHHFHVKLGALADTLLFKQLVSREKLLATIGQFNLDIFNCA